MVKKDCKCNDKCDCEHDEYLDECNCDCDDECLCDCGCEDCDCEHEDEEKEYPYGDGCACGKGHAIKQSAESREEEYLNMARVIQADFDNYRKRSYEQILQARQEGLIQAIETFLPALDGFNEAKKVITDEKVLEGVEMIEKKILEGFKVLGVEKIEAEGKPFDHNLHNALAIINDNSLDDGIIKAEYQAGYKFKDKVIRYSQVIVNKKEEK